MKKQVLLLFSIISISVFYSACSYKNTTIPNLEVYTIDTLITAEDTAGFIYGNIYEDGSERGTLFEVYTIDIYNNGDSIFSITTVNKNRKLFIYLNDTMLGTYPAATNINTAKTCLVFLDAAVTTISDPLINLKTGNITLNSFDTLTKVYRGTIDVSNVGATKTYEVKGNLAFKMRN
jgi:hypothetical protein